jgi:hypothetical protein
MREKITVRIVFREKGLEDGLGGVRVFGLSPLLVERRGTLLIFCLLSFFL